MPKTSVSISHHFEDFIAGQIQAGRYDTASEVVRAALRLLEEHEVTYQDKLEALKSRLKQGVDQLDQGQGIDGEAFFEELLERPAN